MQTSTNSELPTVPHAPSDKINPLTGHHNCISNMRMAPFSWSTHPEEVPPVEDWELRLCGNEGMIFSNHLFTPTRAGGFATFGQAQIVHHPSMMSMAANVGAEDWEFSMDFEACQRMQYDEQ